MSTQTTSRRQLLIGLAALAGCTDVPLVTPAPTERGGDELRVLVWPGGTAARLGHNHVLRAGDLRVDWPAAGPVLRFRLDLHPGDRIAYRGRDLEVMAASDLNGRRAYLACQCSERMVTG